MLKATVFNSINYVNLAFNFNLRPYAEAEMIAEGKLFKNRSLNAAFW